jgi:ribosomal protein L34E
MSKEKESMKQKRKGKKSLCGICWKKIQGVKEHFQTAGLNAVPDRQ